MSNGEFDLNRRGYLASLGGMAAGSFISSGFVAASSSTVIGDFEDGYDGWKTDGRNELSRTAESDDSWAVTSGEYALAVRSASDPQPLIERQLDGVPARYLLADLSIPDMADDPARTTVEVRLRYDRSRPTNQSGQRSKPSGGKPLVTLDAREVPFAYQGTLAWDLGGLDTLVTNNANRIQFVWRRSDAGTEGKPHGNGPGQGYGGTVTWDNIRFSDDVDAFRRTMLANHVSNLRSQHGDYRYEFERLEDGREVGRYAFADGTNVRVTFAPVAENEWKLTIGEESYRIELGA